MIQTLFSELLERQYGRLCTWDLCYMKKIFFATFIDYE